MFSTLSSRAGCRSFCSSSLDPGTPPLPLLQALDLLLQDSSVLCLWTFIIGLGSPPKAKAPVFLLQALVSPVPLVFQRTQLRGVGPSQRRLLTILPAAPGRWFFCRELGFSPGVQAEIPLLWWGWCEGCAVCLAQRSVGCTSTVTTLGKGYDGKQPRRNTCASNPLVPTSGNHKW